MRSLNLFKLIYALTLGLAFFVVCECKLTAQVRTPTLKELPKLSAAQAAQLLDKTRQIKFAQDYCLHITLIQMPRKGPKSLAHGIIWGTQAVEGPRMRVQLWTSNLHATQSTISMLLQGGPHPEAWKISSAGLPQALEESALNQSILPGFSISAFELQLGFLYWTDAQYLGPMSVKGRQAQCFELYPSKDTHSEYSKVRIAVDNGFYCLLKAEFFDLSNKTTRTLKILDFKKAGKQWMVQSLDFIDTLSHNKVRLQITAAALDIILPTDMFTPNALVNSIPTLAPEKFILF